MAATRAGYLKSLVSSFPGPKRISNLKLAEHEKRDLVAFMRQLLQTLRMRASRRSYRVQYDFQLKTGVSMMPKAPIPS